MEIFRIWFFLTFLGLNQLNGQFFEDFSDNDLSLNPEWIGNLDHFAVNEDEELQLNAPSAGSSTLFTPFVSASEFQWDLEFELDFSPSNSNQLRIFLLADDSMLDDASGYYIQIGETGNEDALELVNAATGRIIATGISGRVATGPLNMKLRVVLHEGNRLEFSSQLEDEDLYTLEIIAEDIDVTPGDYFFGLQCLYTATRSDKFSFKSIELASPSVDESAPRLLEIIESGPDRICLRFNETIDETLSNEEMLISVDGDFVENLSFLGREVKLNLASAAAAGPVTISIMGVSDGAGNRLDTLAVLIRETTLEKGSVLINEVLFDPLKGGDDFVELINTTDQLIDLKNVTLENRVSGRSVTINSSYILEPFGIIAFAEDKDEILDNYKSANEMRIIEHRLPDLPNKSGNITLHKQGVDLDFFNYSEDFHNDLLDDTEGVSLERRSTDSGSEEQNTWTSASASAGYATPGSENSALIIDPVDDIVIVNADSFSPNEDGDNDVLEISLRPRFESLGSIWIYDQSGNMVYQLLSNSLLGAQELVSWDGKLEGGERAPIGIYVIRVEVFNTGGQVYNFKKAIALVDFIN